MKTPRRKLVFEIMLAVAVIGAIGIGVSLGLALAETRNSVLVLQAGHATPALPTKILDINDREITEFFRDEKRTMISITDVPQDLINALVTKEDQHFFSHRGYDVQGILRAAWYNITGQYLSGSSTLTMQLVGALKIVDRTDISVRRKLKELWWAIQLERQYTKNEILEMYMNYVSFGSGNNGVEAASQYLFRHGVKNLTLAESVMLVIQISLPGRYNPFSKPERASKMQKAILQRMVGYGYCTQAEADASYADYWARFDYTRSGTITPYMERTTQDKAPYFSGYVREYLEDTLLGSWDIYKDGLVVHTTLNLDYQAEADRLMNKGIDHINELYLTSAGKTENTYGSLTPLMDMFGLAFNIDSLQYKEINVQAKWRKRYAKDLNPVVDLLSYAFGMDEVQGVAGAGYDAAQEEIKRTLIQGALISLDSRKGYILAMVGGRERKSTDENNRAVYASVMPGSTFKPLYYSAAIDSRKFTAASMILDETFAFPNADGTFYTPQNFKGEFHGRVLLRNALADSMNIPSLRVLKEIGFDAAIQRSSRMLGITDPAEIVRVFPRYYPLGLGIISISPLQMARAYAVFANQGREVEPIAVRYIEDRNGKIILDAERELRAKQARKDMQIMSPQTAYIMTSILRTTLEEGTLRGNFSLGDLEERPMSGKTGTTDNWGAIWTVGFSPQITTAIWFGFDEGSRSMGVKITGATQAGPIWAAFMRAAHKNLPPEKFIKPDTGLVEMTVSETSGLLPTEYSAKKRVEIFLAGTEPKTFDQLDEYYEKKKQETADALKNAMLKGDVPADIPGISLPPLEAPVTGPETSESGNSLLD